MKRPEQQLISFDEQVRGQSRTHEAALVSAFEYDCQDCGSYVFAYGRPPVPGRERCAECQWIAAIPDPSQRAALRLRFGRSVVEAVS